MTERAITAIVVDDHTLFRELLADLLALESWLDVRAQGKSGADAIALARQHRPDVALLDVQMPGPGIEETVRQVHRHSPQTRCVVLTMHDDPGLLGKLLEEGVAAYLLKSVSSGELLTSIRSVIREPERIHLAVSRDMIRALSRSRRAPALLTSREAEILRHVAQARSNAEIARTLFVAETTIKRHLTNAYRKLGAVSRVDAIRRAQAAGILDEFP